MKSRDVDNECGLRSMQCEAQARGEEGGAVVKEIEMCPFFKAQNT